MAAETDWEGIERDYRAGVLSVREIGAAYGVSHTAIQKRARRDGWERDLLAKVRAKADAKVAKAAVASVVSKEDKATEAAIVEANADVIAKVRLAHRTDINKARGLAMTLLAELEHQTGNQDLYENLFELLNDPEDEGGNQAAKDRQNKRLEAFQRAMSLGNRTKTMKDLADTLKSLIALEREAYSIDGKGGEQQPGDPLSPAEPQDVARRLAFVLRRGLQAANDPKQPPAAKTA